MNVDAGLIPHEFNETIKLDWSPAQPTMKSEAKFPDSYRSTVFRYRILLMPRMTSLRIKRIVNMLRTTMGALFITIGLAGTAMAGQRIIISSDWGQVTAELAENNAAKALADMLPLTIEMSDHLRQEKTGNLPSALPSSQRQRDFSTGTLGLWSSGDFVIYYRDGQVPNPGIVILGKVTGDVSIFDRPGAVKVRVEAAQ